MSPSGDWIRVHSDIDEDDRVLALPSDAARWAWIVVLCKGKRQPVGGEWASETHLRAVLADGTGQ